MDTIFQLANLYVMPFWLLAIALPRRGWALRIMRSPLIALPLALTYIGALLGLGGSDSSPGGGLTLSSFATLQGVATLLGAPQGALFGWVHFLAFDLFTGRWIYLDAHERGIHPTLVAVPLFFTLMLGPLGLALYLALRYARARYSANQS
jgi:apolipoprotein N-acyltransferase